MATIEIEQLRGLTDGAEEYTDEQLVGILSTAGSQSAAARTIWRAKAAATATMVDISESGSSRKLSDLHKNALAMAASFEKDDIGDLPGKIKRTRRAVRR